MPAYYERHGGMVVSTTISYYIYTILTPSGPNSGVQIISADYRDLSRRPTCEDLIWNGDLVPCCVDYEGHGVFGNIMDANVLELKTPAFSLCDTCPGHPGNVV